MFDLRRTAGYEGFQRVKQAIDNLRLNTRSSAPSTTALSSKSGTQLVDEYFIENRTRLLDVAAYLDRLDRAGDDQTEDDFRMRAFRKALLVLCDASPGRTARIQMVFSDPTTEPLEMLDQKSARGAYNFWQEVEG